MKSTFVAILFFLFAFVMHTFAQVKCLGTAHLGPNALPIPDMIEGTISGDLRLEIAADYFEHTNGNITFSPYGKLTVPLYPTWVNLTIWASVVEYYWNNNIINLSGSENYAIQSGKEFGDVYISTDIQVLKQRKYRPDIALRAVMKTASGGSYRQSRHTDSPGYFFDATIAKSLYLTGRFEHELRLAANIGFLCWQVGQATQNDAYMYGVQLKWSMPYLSAKITWGGYTGWINNGDAPMSIKTEIRGNIYKFEPFVLYQLGLRDYPYHQFRIGLAYGFDVHTWAKSLKEKKKNKNKNTK